MAWVGAAGALGVASGPTLGALPPVRVRLALCILGERSRLPPAWWSPRGCSRATACGDAAPGHRRCRSDHLGRCVARVGDLAGRGTRMGRARSDRSSGRVGGARCSCCQAISPPPRAVVAAVAVRRPHVQRGQRGNVRLRSSVRCEHLEQRALPPIGVVLQRRQSRAVLRSCAGGGRSHIDHRRTSDGVGRVPHDARRRQVLFAAVVVGQATLLDPGPAPWTRWLPLMLLLGISIGFTFPVMSAAAVSTLSTCPLRLGRRGQQHLSAGGLSGRGCAGGDDAEHSPRHRWTSSGLVPGRRLRTPCRSHFAGPAEDHQERPMIWDDAITVRRDRRRPIPGSRRRRLDIATGCARRSCCSACTDRR